MPSPSAGRKPETMRENESQWLWSVAMPGLFAFLFASGIIGAKSVLAFAEPLTFLFYRFVLVVALLAPFVVLIRSAWPTSRFQVLHSIVAGAFMHGVVMGGFFLSMNAGMPAGIAGLIFGIQPTFAALFSQRLLGERVSLRQWGGLMLGFVGLVLVLGMPLIDVDKSGVSATSIAFACVAVLGMTIGTIYQKAFATETHLVTGGLLQHVGAAMVVGIGAFGLETGAVNWTPAFVVGLAWLVVVVSIGAITLYMVLIRRGAVSKVSALFYLVPPITATISYFMFGETLTTVQLSGFAVTVFAVWLVTGRR